MRRRYSLIGVTLIDGRAKSFVVAPLYSGELLYEVNLQNERGRGVVPTSRSFLFLGELPG